VEAKPPLGYFYKVKSALESIGTSTPATFDIDIPQGLLTVIFDPIRLGVAGILWFFFLVHFYHRVKNMSI